MPAITGMKGEGYYDQHSAPQAAGIQLVESWLTEAAGSVPLPAATQPIVAVDFGSSEGRNAIGAMRLVAAALRQRTGQPMQTVYSDLPSNNFNRLFANLSDPKLVGGFPAEVYPSAVPGSFYRPMLPPGSAHMAMCFNAILWLDRLPQSIPDHVAYRRPNPPRPGLAVPAATAAAFSEQAATDLVHFYQARAREMVPGGKLIVASPGDDDQGRCCDGLYDVVNDACRDLVAAGQVSQERYEALTIPVYFRTLTELLAPLSEDHSPVQGTFVVERVETSIVPTPFEVEFDRTGDAEAYGAAFAGFLRAFSEPVVRSALVKPGEDGAIIDSIYQRISERIRAEPARYRFRYVQVAALLRRC